MVDCTSTAVSLFPNAIIPLGRIGFPINLFWPIDKDTTRLDWIYYALPPTACDRFDPDDLPEHWQQRRGVYNQIMAEDERNMAPMQRSMASPALHGIPINYQERRIWHLHEEIDRMIGPERIPEQLRMHPVLGPYVEEPPTRDHEPMTETITGTNRSAGISLSELLDADSHPVSDLLRNESRVGVREGNTRIPAWYYTSPEFHALEVEKLWSRVWQLACLVEEIPNVGDYHVYEIADMSFLIVRTADGIKAFRNACLHRGRRLRETNGEGAKNIRCAFHGWSWNLDGSLKEIPCEWDFPSVTEPTTRCPKRWWTPGTASCSSTPTPTPARSPNTSPGSTTTSPHTRSKGA